MDNEIKRNRIYGFDILRCIVMILIIIHHILLHGGILRNVVPFSNQYFFAWFLEVLAYCAVDIFALLSGYVGLNSTFDLKKIRNIWLNVVLYSVSFTVINFIVFDYGNLMDFTKGILRSIMPVSNYLYWYFTAYVGMMFFSPLINVAVNSFSKQQLIRLLFMVVIVYSVIPTILHKDPFGLADGYTVLWISILYFCGAVLRKNEVSSFIKLNGGKKISWRFIVITSLWLVWLTKVILDRIDFMVSGNLRGGYLLSYTSPVILLASIYILIGFRDLYIGIKVRSFLAKVSKSVFYVYIIHENPYVSQWIIRDHFVNFAKLSSVELCLKVIGIAALIFAMCTIVDGIKRSLISFIIKAITVITKKNIIL